MQEYGWIYKIMINLHNIPAETRNWGKWLVDTPIFQADHTIFGVNARTYYVPLPSGVGFDTGRVVNIDFTVPMADTFIERLTDDV